MLVFAWLVLPILTAYYLSRTGQYESAHVLSSLALTGLVTAVAAETGGIGSFAAIWLVVVPLEAALSASRRVVALASTFALVAAGLLVFLGTQAMLPPIDGSEAGTLAALGIISAALYATGSRTRRRVAGANELLAALRRGGSLPPSCTQHDRRHHPAWQERRGAVRFAGGGNAVRHQGERAARSPPVRSRACRRSAGLSHRACRRRGSGRGAFGGIPGATRSAGSTRAQRAGQSHRMYAIHLGRDALPAARSRQQRNRRAARWSR